MILVTAENPKTAKCRGFDTWDDARLYAIKKLHELDAGNEFAGRRWRDQATKQILRESHPVAVHADKITITFESYEDARNYWTNEAAREVDDHLEWADYDDDKGESRREEARMLEDAKEAEEMNNPHGPRSLELPDGRYLYLERIEG